MSDWRGKAACRDMGYDAEIFFPLGRQGRNGSAAADAMEAQAKAICRRCTVRSDCLAEALERSREAGIWGGTTPEERKALRGRM